MTSYILSCNPLLVSIFFLFSMSLFCAEIDDKNKKPPVSDEVVTQHRISLEGQEIEYEAVTGMYPIKDEQEVVKAHFFYVAYTKAKVEGEELRPIAFCFNGGPGAASIFLHMGMLGPKRVALNEEGVAWAPPFGYIDNPNSLLDSVDLVFIDPVSTGYSRALSGEEAKKFYDVEEDVKSVAEFIRLYITRNSRWDSPKFLVGASYGTIRATELGTYLYDKFNISINGVVLISAILNFQTIDSNNGNNDLPFILYLPSYAAAAWNYKKLSNEYQSDFQKTLSKAKSFALQDYSLALLQGRLLLPEKRKEIVGMLSALTGLSQEYLERVDLRPRPEEYTKALLNDEEKVIGRFDSRIQGFPLEITSNYSNYDPSLDGVLSVFSSAFNQYVRNDLKWVKDEDYRALAEVHPWSYGKATNRFFTATEALKGLLIRIPTFSAFVASGYYDLATPYFGTDYSLDHLTLPQAYFSRLVRKYYPAGHMIYVDKIAGKDLSNDVRTYIKETLSKSTTGK